MNRILVLVFASSACLAQGAFWQLGNDFSNTTNPNGVWTLLKNPTMPFTSCWPDYYQNSSNQPTWAEEQFPQNAHVPFWASSTVDNFQGLDLKKGDVFAHGAETDRTGTDYTAVRWTAPHAGVAAIQAYIWNVRVLGRTMVWEIKKNGVAVSQGLITSNGSYPSTSKLNLASGSGGPAALNHAVVAGDTLELGLTSSPPVVGEIMGIIFNVATDQPSRLVGSIVPSDYIGDLSGKTVTCEVWSGSTLVNKPKITLGPGGTYAFDPTPNGAVSLRFRMQSTLVKTANVVLGSSSQVLNVALISGDIDASGEVDAADIDAVIADFGLTTDVPADVDGSAEVDAADIDVVISRFGEVDA
ncbi:MAG: hypothetical protein JNK63_00030 [Chthonomonas sp.]|nr:hypothetical protein [Chthonomonas sp.]